MAASDEASPVIDPGGGAGGMPVPLDPAAQRQFQRWFRTLDDQIRVLERERQKFSAIVQQADALCFVTDAAGDIRWTNTSLGERAPHDGSWIGGPCRAVCSHLTGCSPNGCHDCPVRRAAEQGVTVHEELRHVTGEGAGSHYLTALPIRRPDGGVEEILVMIQDLTDLESIRRSESRYRLLFERSAKAIMMVDPASGKTLLANPMACRLTGRSSSDLHGLPIVDLHSAEEWARVANRYSRLFTGEGWPQFECKLTAANGALRTVLVSGTRVDFEDSEAVMLEYQDLTEQRSVQKALRDAENRLGTVISSAPIVLFVVDADGVFTMSEGKGLEALGLKAGQVVGCSAFELYRDVPAIAENLRRALAGEALTVTVEVGKLAFETHYEPIFDAEGRPNGALGVAVNVTERQQLEEELRHAQKMEAIGRLAGGVAHDFNNLLAAILGHAELLLLKLGDHPGRRYAEEIQKAGTRGALLTRQLLAFSRKEVVSPMLIDLGQLVAEASKDLRRLIGDGIELKIVRTMSATPVHGDRGQIEQIISNLVVNSREAMPRGGLITIEVSEVELSEADSARCGAAAPGRFVTIAAHDTGCGMDAETRTRIFEPFFTTKETGRGSGLGLAIVYAIVRRSGGGVEVESTPGQGTTFRILLPRADAPETQPEVAEGAPVIRTGNEIVLLVEDEDAVRVAVREALIAAGFQVIEAANGEDALTRAEEASYKFDLLLSDVVMPRMPGTEVLRRLRVHRPDLRVLFVSGYTDAAVVHQGALEHGVVFLQKPCSLTAIVNKVGEILDTPESRRPAA